MKRIKKLITTILLGALTLSVFAFAGCGKTNEELTKNDNADVGIAVLTSYSEITPNGQNCLVKDLIATVSGKAIKDIELEWYTVWEKTNDADISDYLVLEPGAYNEDTKSATCKIKLIAPITETAVVYVKCKNNNISARCLVDYSPSTHAILVDVSSLYVVEDSYYNTEINVLEVGNNYSFDISSFGFFGEEHSIEDIEVEYTAVGKFKMKDDYSGESGVSFDKYLTSFINPTVEMDSTILETSYKPYLKYSIDNNKLMVNAVNSVYNLRFQIKSGSLMNYFSFYSLIEENEPYVTLTLKNTATNASVSYNFRVYPKLSISLDKNTITFS